MLIRCPECHFEREIDTTQIPASATVATCPKCSNRFRFRDPATGRSVLETPDHAVSGDTTGAGHPPASPGNPPEDLPSAQSGTPHMGTEQDGDDPLPPGAVIPTMTSGEQSTTGANPRQAQKTRQAEPDKAEHDQPLGGQVPPVFSKPNPLRPASAPKNQTQDAPAPSDFPDTLPYGVPWEHMEHYGFPGALLHTILRVMFRAPDFFRSIHSSAPLTKAIIFFIMMSVLDVLIYRMWAINALQSFSETVTDPATLSTLQELLPASGMDILMLLLFTPFIALFRLFFFAALYHVMIRLVQPDKADFPTVARVVAYSSATYILSIVPVAGSMLGSLWFVAATFIGCKFALDLPWSKVTLALLPLFLLAGAVAIQASRVLVASMAGL